MKTLKTFCLIVLASLAPLFAQAGPPQGRVIPDYRIGPMDEVSVTVASPVPQQEFADKKYRVQSDGTIILPHLDKPVQIGGLTVQKARELIRQRLIDAQQYDNPTVDVIVTEYRNSSVTVQGAVRAPGNTNLRADRMTLSDAISAAGGFQTNAGSRVWVRGPQRPKPDADIQVDDQGEVYRKDDISQGKVDVAVYDGDSIFVEVAPHFYVTGYVKNSNAEFSWYPGITLQKAIAMAGGVSPEGAENRISVERKDPKTGKFTKIKLAKDKMSTIIEPDDVIKVPKKRM